MRARIGLCALVGLLALVVAVGLLRPAAAPPAPVEAVPAPVHSARIALPQQSSAPGIKTLLNVGKRMRYGDFVWNDEKVPAGPVWVRIDLGAQLISVFRAGHEVGTAVILHGQDGKPTPPGRYPILEKNQHHRSNLYDAEMPYMVRLTNDGIAIHASEVRAGKATHGCIGVPAEFAKHLFDAVKRGDEVLIVA